MLYSFGMEIRYILDIGVLGCEGGVDESQISKYRYKKMTNIEIQGRNKQDRKLETIFVVSHEYANADPK